MTRPTTVSWTVARPAATRSSRACPRRPQRFSAAASPAQTTTTTARRTRPPGALDADERDRGHGGGWRSRRIIGTEPAGGGSAPRDDLNWGGDAHDRPAWPCARRALAATGPAQSRVRRRGRPRRGASHLRGRAASRGGGAARPQRAVRRRPPRRSCGCPPRCWPPRWRASTPTSAPPWRSRPAAPGWCTRTSAAPTPRPQVVPGGTVTERWVPVDRVGLYVPGGVAVLASSVVMNVVPAQAAGVPARWPSPARPSATTRASSPATRTRPILAACALLGVDEVYAVGGAQAIAMFAYGASETGADGTPAPARSSASRSTWSPARATSTSSPPSGCSRA